MQSQASMLWPPPPVSPDIFPRTRFQGSKRKLLSDLHEVFSRFSHKTALDLYTGSGSVALLLRTMGARVHANDLLSFNANSAFLFLNASNSFLSKKHHDHVIRELLETPCSGPAVVSEIFRGLFFSDFENRQIDNFCQNSIGLDDLSRSLYAYCIGQALLMKRPYNLFHRANLEMRTRDVERSFGNKKTWETPILDHSLKILRELRSFPFSLNAVEHAATSIDAGNIERFPRNFDLVYLDPPYIDRRGVGVDYCDFYHFLEGLMDYSLFADPRVEFPHKPLVRRRSAWLSVERAQSHLIDVIRHFADSTIIMSYRSDGSPSLQDLTNIFKLCGREVSKELTKNYKYALSRSAGTEEILLVAPT